MEAAALNPVVFEAPVGCLFKFEVLETEPYTACAAPSNSRCLSLPWCAASCTSLLHSHRSPLHSLYFFGVPRCGMRMLNCAAACEAAIRYSKARKLQHW